MWLNSRDRLNGEKLRIFKRYKGQDDRRLFCEPAVDYFTGEQADRAVFLLGILTPKDEVIRLSSASIPKGELIGIPRRARANRLLIIPQFQGDPFASPRLNFAPDRFRLIET